jgi:hypothetical protein
MIGFPGWCLKGRKQEGVWLIGSDKTIGQAAELRITH